MKQIVSVKKMIIILAFLVVAHTHQNEASLSLPHLLTCGLNSRHLVMESSDCKTCCVRCEKCFQHGFRTEDHMRHHVDRNAWPQEPSQLILAERREDTGFGFAPIFSHSLRRLQLTVTAARLGCAGRSSSFRPEEGRVFKASGLL